MHHIFVLTTALLWKAAQAEVSHADNHVIQNPVNESASSVQGICDSIHSLQCYGDDLKNIGPVSTSAACCQACQSNPECKAWTWNFKYGKDCYLKRACSDRRTSSDAYHSGVGTGTTSPRRRSSPTPPRRRSPPTPPRRRSSPTPPRRRSHPTSDNPLGISPAKKRSDNYFLLLGDWGAPTDASWAHSCGGCQRKIADMMKDYVKKHNAEGQKCLFVGSLGDNFYASGLKDHDHWKKQWGDIYGTADPSSGLHDIPWLSVMGNHDIGNDDPTCACGKGCKQFNDASRPGGTDKFWMPDYYWHYYIKEVELEIIGLDTNAIDVNSLNGNGCSACDKVCGGRHAVTSYLTGKMNAGLSYVEERAKATEAKTVLLMQHYDPDYKVNGRLVKEKFDNANGGRTKSVSAYGHKHDQVCQGSKEHGCDLILSGGGGGWKGGQYFGFVAVHLDDHGGFMTNMESSEVRISQHECQYLDDLQYSNDLLPGYCVENMTLTTEYV